MVASEIAVLPFKAGVDVSDASSAAFKIWQESLATISAQDGALEIYWGRRLEDQSIMDFCVDWESVEHHQVFMSSPQYAPFVKKLQALLGNPPTLHHVLFDSSTSILARGTIEMATFTVKNRKEFTSNLQKFVDFTKNDNTGTVMIGQVVEDDGEGNGKVVLSVAWKDMEAHEQFRNSEAFKSHIHYLRSGVVARELHHTVFVKH